MAPTLISTASAQLPVVPQSVRVSALDTASLGRMRATLRKSYIPNDTSVRTLMDYVTKVHTTQRAAKAAGASFSWQAALSALVRSQKSTTLLTRLHQLEYASSFPQRRKELRTSPKYKAVYTKELVRVARNFFPFLSRVIRPGDELSYKSGGQLVQMAERIAAIMPKSPAELVSALQVHKARLAVLRDQVERAKAGDPALVSQLPQLEAAYKKALQDGAALVTASKLKQASMAGMIKRCRRIQIKNEAERQARYAQVAASLKKMDTDLQALDGQVRQASSPALRAQLMTKLQVGKSARGTLVQRFKLLRQGEDLTPINYVQTSQKLKPVGLTLTGEPLTVDPVLRRVMIRYLASKLPRRPGESRCDFVERLRMYTKRTLVRYLAAQAQGMEAAAAAEAAVVDTLTQDAPVMEEAVAAGGQPADTGMDAVSHLVDAMETDVEQATTDLAPETASASPISDYVSPSVGEEILASSSEALDPAFVNAQLDASIAEIGVAGNLDVSPSVTTEDGETLVFQDAAEGLAEDAEAGVAEAGAWYKNPFVIGAAVLAAAFAFGG